MTPREKLDLLKSYRAAGGTGSYVSLIKEAKQYSTGGPKKKLPELPAFNIQQSTDNTKMQYPIETDIFGKEAAIARGQEIRLKEKEESLKKHYAQSGLVGLGKNPSEAEIKYQAKKAVEYNDKLSNDPVGTLGPDLAMAVVPELLMMKGPQQAISKGLSYINPVRKGTPWTPGTKEIISDVIENPWKINPFRFKPNPNAYYHRSKDIKNIINENEGVLQGFGQSEAGALFNETAGPMRGKINLKKKQIINYIFLKVFL
jgi:hypothetical protein